MAFDYTAHIVGERKKEIYRALTPVDDNTLTLTRPTLNVLLQPINKCTITLYKRGKMCNCNITHREDRHIRFELINAKRSK